MDIDEKMMIKFVIENCQHLRPNPSCELHVNVRLTRWFDEFASASLVPRWHCVDAIKSLDMIHEISRDRESPPWIDEISDFCLIFSPQLDRIIIIINTNAPTLNRLHAIDRSTMMWNLKFVDLRDQSCPRTSQWFHVSVAQRAASDWNITN